MSSEGLHVPREKLSPKTLHMHYAITSLIEELEAVDWYRQRADDTSDAELKFLGVSTQLSPDIADYPDFGTFGVLLNDPPVRFVGRLKDTLTYFPEEKG